MPELPEVETVKNVIEPLIKNKRISKVSIYNKGTIVTDLNSFASYLEGETILSMDRKGKFLIFLLSNNKAMLSHLRMEGKYFFFEEKYERSKHDMVSFTFSDGTVLAYNDVRKFGILGCYDQDKLMTDSDLAKLGKEPFVISKEELFSSLKRAKTTIKEALLDQSRIAGLGNIYVDEVCFASSIHPKSKPSSITLEQCDLIIKNAIRILNEAIKEGGSTIKSFHPSKGVDGRMQNRLKVYGHENEVCPNCGTKLRKIVVGGRGTTFCPKCQKNPDLPLVVGVTGPIHSGKSTVSNMLEEKGFTKIDCDKIVHDLYESKPILDKLKEMFGPVIFNDDKLDKRKLSEILADRKDLKSELVSFIHPLVCKKAKEIISKTKNSKVIFEVPLLVGSGCEDLCDYVILVIADEDKRKLRLENENRDADSLMKINKSYRLTETSKIATYTVENNGDLKQLSMQISNILKNLE